jgi:hypothetical protein
MLMKFSARVTEIHRLNDLESCAHATWRSGGQRPPRAIDSRIYPRPSQPTRTRYNTT